LVVTFIIKTLMQRYNSQPTLWRVHALPVSGSYHALYICRPF